MIHRDRLASQERSEATKLNRFLIKVFVFRADSRLGRAEVRILPIAG
jgi:hypothetical protein